MRTLIVGPAKTGTTALLYMIAHASGNTQVYMEEPASSLRKLPQDCVAKLIFEQESEEALLNAAAQFDRRILLLRDPRDNLLSRLLFSITAREALLADDAFLDTLLAKVHAKQEDPDAHALSSIAGMFPANPSGMVEESIERGWRYAKFVARYQKEWQIVYYEDLVAGNLRGLKRYLGLSLPRELALPPEYAHIARSKRSGDWKHWFTADDVAALRPAFAPLLEALGYDDEWTRDGKAQILPQHAQQYMLDLIQRRRRFHGMPPYLTRLERAPAPPGQCCNICRGSEFGHGPNGRSADNGSLPRCVHCGALERQRIVRSLFQAIPLGFLDWRRGLQFSPDPAVCTELFRSFEVSVYGGQNSLDIQAIDRPDGSYDFISLNHVLEFVPDDLKGFDEMLRVLSPRGIIQACFSTPLSRQTCEDYSAPFGPHEAWHLYGLDLKQRFKCAENNLSVLVVEASDPCTGTREIVHFFLKDKEDLGRITSWLAMSRPDARILA